MIDVVLWSLFVLSVAFLLWHVLVALAVWGFVRQSLRNLKDTLERKEQIMNVVEQQTFYQRRLEEARRRYIADHGVKHASPRYLGTETRWQRFVRFLAGG